MAARPDVALTPPGSAAPISSSPVSRKTAPITPTAGISDTTSHKYSSGLPALAYDTVDDLLAQIGAARREVSKRNYQIAIEEAALASRAMESEDQLSALRPLLAEQIGCASRIYDEVRQVVSLVDPDAAGALPDSVFVWKEADVEGSLRVSLEGTRMALDIASMALHKVGAWRDSRNTKVSELELRVEELVREKEHIGVLLRSALQANTSEVLKVTEDGLREAGIDIGLNNGHRDNRRPGSAHKDDEVYTLEGALETSIKESQIKIIELQHLVQAQRAESGLLRTRMEGQEKEIGQLRKQIKHLEEKERVANDSVEGLMMDVAAAEEEIKTWKMAAQEEADAGRSIEQEFQIQEGALETSIKESQTKIIELQHLVQAQRAESGLLRTRMEGQEKEIGQLRRQIKHLEEKERVANDSVEGLMMDVAAAQEEIKIWKMAAEEESHAGRSIEQEFQIQASLFAMASELGSPTRAAERTIMDLGDDLLCEIFLLLPSLPSLVRAALACTAFLHAVRLSPAFRRRFQALHPPQLLGFFRDHCRCIPQFFPLRARHDPDHTAVIRGADFFLTRLTEDSAHYPHWWEFQSCHGGYVILVNMVHEQIATYNPLTQALHIFPFPPAKFGRFGAIEFHIIFSEEDLGVFRMVCVVHRKTPTCIAVISSATMKWTRVPQPDDGGEDMNFNVEFDQGRQVNALVYWKHLRQDYALVLNTTTLQISRVDMSLGGKGSKLGHSKDGQLCMVGTDDSVAHIGNLFVWVWRAADDDVEKWILEYTRPLSTLVGGHLSTSVDYYDVTMHVEAVIDGFVYLCANTEEHVSLLSLCLETEELNTLFEDTYANLADPYFMAWPLSLICNKVGKLAKSRNKRKRRKYTKNPPKAYPPLFKVGKLLRARIRKRQRDGKMLRSPQKHTLNL